MENNMKEKVFTLSRKDYRVDTFRGSGPGGQHRNKTDSAVRITHIDSGVVSESKTEIEQRVEESLTPESLKWI